MRNIIGVTSVPGITIKRVTITAVDEAAGIAQARDALGKELQVRCDRRAKGTAVAAVGELWTVDRIGYTWVLGERLGNPVTPVVAGSRTGLHPTMVSLLSALAQLGLVDDQTTP